MTSVVIIQARLGSTRLPGKVLEPLAGKPMLLHVTRRAAEIGPDRTVVATTEEPQDDAVVELAESQRIDVWRASEHDVLDRYYCAAQAFEADAVVRVTADCPLLDPAVSRVVLDRLLVREVDEVATARLQGARSRIPASAL